MFSVLQYFTLWYILFVSPQYGIHYTFLSLLSLFIANMHSVVYYRKKMFFLPSHSNFNVRLTATAQQINNMENGIRAKHRRFNWQGEWRRQYQEITWSFSTFLRAFVYTWIVLHFCYHCNDEFWNCSKIANQIGYSDIKFECKPSI